MNIRSVSVTSKITFCASAFTNITALTQRYELKVDTSTGAAARKMKRTKSVDYKNAIDEEEVEINSNDGVSWKMVDCNSYSYPRETNNVNIYTDK